LTKDDRTARLLPTDQLKEPAVATVMVQAVASLDGYVARPDDLPGPIFDWYEAGDAYLTFRPGGSYLSRVRCVA
jgi:hypothetical protein